jgi:hypothetical protein
MSAAQSEAVALWAVHTHAIEAAETTPYLHICSPEPQCGKTRLGLEVLPLLVAKPLPTTNMSEAALFRSIQLKRPTLLLDEIDAIFGPKAKNHEDLRGMLNAGYRRGVPVHRCVGDGAKIRVEEFEVFCPKALVGIGELPETLATRSLRIRLERRAVGEHVERFRYRAAADLAEPLRLDLAQWAESDVGQELAKSRPDLPDELNDRTQDALEPLIAIADAAGGDWPQRARQAFVELCTGGRERDASLGVRLLADSQRAFRDRGEVATSELIDTLAADEEAPWAALNDGKPITPRRLGNLLRRYGIESRTVWLPDVGKTLKGYKREQFESAWSRYLAPENVIPSGLASHEGFGPASSRQDRPGPDASRAAPNPYGQRDLTDLTDRNGRKAGSGDVMNERAVLAGAEEFVQKGQGEWLR